MLEPEEGTTTTTTTEEGPPGEPPSPPALYTRREVGGLGSDTGRWDPVMEAYARAVATMQARDPRDPTSWSYQAAIHGRVGPPRPLYNQCQHATWYFLPWHRMYLYRFEQIVRAAVIADDGPEDWALPYWDYSRPAPGDSLPWVFRTPALPDGRPNPLLVRQRRQDRNAGAPLPSSATDSTTALAQTRFTISTPGVVPGFGGPQTGFAHFGSGFGALESVPHNVVHVQIGGWMSDPDTAAQDPIFWLHHANIDRLWEVWIRQPRSNTPLPAWTGFGFDLFDETGAVSTLTCGQVEDIENQLGYTYEDLPAPAAPAPPAGPGFGLAPEEEAPVSEEIPAEVVGTTGEPLMLQDRSAAIDLAIEAPTRPPGRGLAPDEPRPVYLTVDDITADAPPSTSYEVVVTCGDSAEADEVDRDLVAGVVAFFGVVQAARDDQEEAPHGLRFTFEVTDIVERLRERGDWDGEQVRVRFEPVEPADAGEEATEVSVGRVSLSYQ